MFLLKKRRALLFIIDTVELLFLANNQRSSLSFLVEDVSCLNHETG